MTFAFFSSPCVGGQDSAMSVTVYQSQCQFSFSKSRALLNNLVRFITPTVEYFLNFLDYFVRHKLTNYIYSKLVYCKSLKLKQLCEEKSYFHKKIYTVLQQKNCFMSRRILYKKKMIISLLICNVQYILYMYVQNLREKQKCDCERWRLFLSTSCFIQTLKSGTRCSLEAETTLLRQTNAFNCAIYGP